MTFCNGFSSIRFKLIASLITVSLFIGLVTLLEGGNLLYNSVLNEVTNRIQQDLNVARAIYDQRQETVRTALAITSASPYFNDIFSAQKQSTAAMLQALNDNLKLDFLGVVNAHGRLVYSADLVSPGQAESFSRNPLAQQSLQTQQPIAGTLAVTQEQLLVENPSLAARITIDIQPAYAENSSDTTPETTALIIGAAIPLFQESRLVGSLYAGYLLNRGTDIVDKIGATVFKNEIYKDRNVGTATIFHQDLRIATNVKDHLGQRALGTRAAPQVSQRVLGEGKKWIDRARVLEDWYITAYEPITDLLGTRVGMLYVGVLEAKYWDVRKKAIILFAGITLAGVVIAILLGWLFTGRIMRPVSYLIKASSEIKNGNFSPDIGPVSKGDIGQLQKNFLVMTEALKEREERQKEESDFHLIQSEKHASVGKLAAGVAHEINNPLTAVLTFTHLLLKRKDLPSEVLEDLSIVATQTERVRKIVKSLLDFSRQTSLHPCPLDINKLIEESIQLLENQALIKGVVLSFHGATGLPQFTLDHNQFQSVLINMVINALDATSPGDTVTVRTQLSTVNSEPGVEITIADTGKGIFPDHMDRIFDPFFTTKEVGKGTGLGLAVSAGIVQRHGGSINVRSKLDTGTTFTIWLPRTAVDEQADLPEGQGDYEYESLGCG